MMDDFVVILFIVLFAGFMGCLTIPESDKGARKALGCMALILTIIMCLIGLFELGVAVHNQIVYGFWF